MFLPPAAIFVFRGKGFRERPRPIPRWKRGPAAESCCCCRGVVVSYSSAPPCIDSSPSVAPRWSRCAVRCVDVVHSRGRGCFCVEGAVSCNRRKIGWMLLT
ncbi:hypothetical protein BKA81DRAFT_31339 [Phyllosticta paracitricarpa]